MRPLVPLLSVACAIGLMAAHRGASAQWLLNGNPVTTAGLRQVSPQAIPDGAGGIIVVWTDHRNGSANQDLYASRLTATGALAPGWSPGGTVVCDASGIQRHPAIASDGAGGAFIAWEDQRGTDVDLYLSHLDASGTRAIEFPPNGLQYGGLTGSQLTPRLAADAAGGVYLAWSDSRGGNFDIYALHLDRNGASYAPAGARAVVRSQGPAPQGNLICGAPGDQTLPQMIYDGTAAALVVWQDGRRPSVNDIYAARVVDSGQADAAWTPDGVALSNVTSGDDTYPTLVTDGDRGAIVAWDGASETVLRAQHLQHSSATSWTRGGVAVGLMSGYPLGIPAFATPDGAGGAFFTWNAGDWMTNHVLASGANAPGWVTPPSLDGLRLGGPNVILGATPLITDGAGGGYLAIDRPGDFGLYMVRFTGAGSLVSGWPANGQVISQYSSNEANVVSDGAGGVIVVWEDQRAGADVGGNALTDLYAQRMLPLGLTGSFLTTLNAVADLPSDQGGAVRLSLTAPVADALSIPPGVTGYNVWRLTSAPAPGPLAATAADAEAARATLERSTREPVVLSAQQATAAGFPPGTWESLGFHAATQSASYLFVIPTRNDSTSAGPADETYFVTAHTPSPFQYTWAGPASAHSVDNLPPAMPQNLSGTFAGSGTVHLTWTANSEADLNGYAVYRGDSPAFVPSPANRVLRPAGTDVSVGGFGPDAYYKVSALDRHDNESGFALLAPGQVTGVNPDDVPRVSYLARPAPNPISDASLLEFGLDRPSRASLILYDAAGRRVRALVEGDLPAGTYRLRWAPRDDAGRALRQGMYLLRFAAAGMVQTRKIAVTR